MKVVTLGTGSPLPDPNRAGAATLVQAAGRSFLFDCGRGVLMRAAAAGVPVGAITSVLLTHLHSDHVTDFNDVLTTRWIQSFAPAPLPVVGPPGTERFTELTLAMLTDDIGWRLTHHPDLTWDPTCDVTEVLDGVAYDDGEVRIVAAPTDHRPVAPTVGYRVEAEGKVVAIAGDTIPCPGLDQLCADADVYVQTAVRADQIAAIPLQRLQDVLDYHSSVEQAGETAARNRVKTLVLTHQVPAPAPGTEGEWIERARGAFSGEVVMAEDLTTIEL